MKSKFTFPVVQFAGLSVGDQTANLGVKMAREAIEIDVADSLFCGRRLTVKIAVGTNGDAESQKRAPADSLEEIETTVDVKRYSVSMKSVTFGLTMALNEIDVGIVARRFAKRAGRLIVTSVDPIPADEADEDDEEDDDAPSLFDGEERESEKPPRRRRKAK